MTTTLALCGVLDAALQGSGAEKHAARLVRAGYLPRSGDEDDAASTPAALRQRRHDNTPLREIGKTENEAPSAERGLRGRFSQS